MKRQKKDGLLQGILSGLSMPDGVAGLAIVSRDGTLLASTLSDEIDYELFAAMSAAIQSAAETQIDELKQGSLLEIAISTTNGKIISKNSGDNAISVILAKNGADMDEIEAFAESICQKLKEGRQDIGQDAELPER